MRLKKVFAALVLVTSAVVATPAAAHAGGGIACWGWTCDGWNPTTAGCAADGIELLGSRTHYDATSSWFELVYSPACQAVWARTTAANRALYVNSYYNNGTYRTTMSTTTSLCCRETPMVDASYGLISEAYMEGTYTPWAQLTQP